jgi:hypothetical protein
VQRIGKLPRLTQLKNSLHKAFIGKNRTRRSYIRQICFIFERSSIQISAWSPDILSMIFRGTSQSFHANFRTELQIKPCPLPFSSFPIHYSLIIKSSRMRWAGHVARIGDKRKVYKLLVGKPERKRPLGRPRRR